MSPADPSAPTPPPAPDTPAGDEALLSLLTDWLPGQRWFAGSTVDPGALSLVHRLPVADTGALIVEWVVVALGGHQDGDHGGRDSIDYQLFVGWRNESTEAIEHMIIGAVDGSICFDALHDHDASALLLDVLARGGTVGAISGVPEPGFEIDPSAQGLVSTAEQSNTSIIFGDDLILKVYRRLEPGTNPDAELLRALAPTSSDDGAHHAPRLAGELVGLVHGASTTLGVATEYFTNCADGWSMATASVRDLFGEADLHADEVGGDFAAESRRLGEAVAAVHRQLADRLGSAPLTGDDTAALLATITDRAEGLIATVPSLVEHASAIREAFTRLGTEITSLPTSVQRIHGDLHLGQVLRTLQGWVLIDFEGEPSRPLAARRALRSPLQDVAGMLRSFDYAAHHMLIAGTADPQRTYRAAEWAQRNRAAFCDGYAEASGSDPREWMPLLTALELDKAIYEVGYEFRHRPLWEPIPLVAISELTASA